MNEINSIRDIRQLAKSGFTAWDQLGNVNVRNKGDLLIFNYSQAAQYEARWNFFERVSRGLIINQATGEIVARPFDKFFNWGEGERTTDAPIEYVMEKADGSLGILMRDNGQCKIATRGSFDSNQALWATDFLQSHYDFTGFPEELTLLFEIIYPDNRIVVDYGNREDLVLLAARDRFAGDYLPLYQVRQIAEAMGFSMPKIYQFGSIDDILKMLPQLDMNQEGFVAVFVDGQRFKFKGDQYLELHRALMRLSFKNILAAVADGTIDDMLARIPDEFLSGVNVLVAAIRATVEQVTAEALAVYAQAPQGDRKTFALWVKDRAPHLASYLFALLDGRDITPMIYKKHDWSEFEGAETIANLL